jgi:quercetin dioxygenase-like cupin family protein
LTRYVFDPGDAIRYRYPTHTNDLIMDRAEATTSEAFFVILEPGEAPPIHTHDDAEQVFFVLEGEGVLGIGPEAAERYPMHVGDFVRTPPGVPHAVSCVGDSRLVYLSIDCFTQGPQPAEPTWDSHVKVLCATNGWDFEDVKRGRVEGRDRAIRDHGPSHPAGSSEA